MRIRIYGGLGWSCKIGHKDTFFFRTARLLRCVGFIGLFYI
jgi:hypothetical protein